MNISWTSSGEIKGQMFHGWERWMRTNHNIYWKLAVDEERCILEPAFLAEVEGVPVRLKLFSYKVGLHVLHEHVEANLTGEIDADEVVSCPMYSLPVQFHVLLWYIQVWQQKSQYKSSLTLCTHYKTMLNLVKELNIGNIIQLLVTELGTR